MRFYDFIQNLNKSNSSNYKLEFLNNFKNDNEIKKLLKMTYDKVNYIYGIGMTNITINKSGNKEIDLNDLKPLYTRQYTGNNAINYLQSLFDEYNKESQIVLQSIIERDLKCSINKKSINKVFKNLIFELPYMRCSLMDKINYIKFPAFLQLKADGTYRSFIKTDTTIEAFSRSGESYFYPELFKVFENLPNGVYIGELLIKNTENLNAQDLRFKSNGLLNSDNVPDELDFFVWDLLSLEEFKKGKSDRTYQDRFYYLNNVLEIYEHSNMIKPIETKTVSNLNEAFEITKKWISEGKEGSILKDFSTKFENKTSNYNIKLKRVFDVDVKITGFTEGKNKRASTFGAITFESSDGKLKGQCSGFTDEELETISKNRESYIGKIMTVEANDVSKAKDSEVYALTFPRFLYFRNDKTEADTLERILESLNGCKNI